MFWLVGDNGLKSLTEGAKAGVDGWRVLLSHGIGEKIYIAGIANTCFNVIFVFFKVDTLSMSIKTFLVCNFFFSKNKKLQITRQISEFLVCTITLDSATPTFRCHMTNESLRLLIWSIKSQ